MRRATSPSHRARTESGQAGIESVPFGILVLIGGMILALNLWSIVDARAGVDAAARDYLRAYTAAPSAARGRTVGAAAATATLTGHGRSTSNMRIDAPDETFGPCALATVTVSVVVTSLRIPFVGGVGDTTVSSTQAELVQPYSTLEPGTVRSLAGTPCDE